MKNKLVKRLLLLFLFTSVFIGVSAQNHIKYTYDKAGNRIKKEIVLTRSAFSNDSDNIKPFTDRMNAVSYTHLDVYKRQSVQCPFRTLYRNSLRWFPQEVCRACVLG